MGPSRVGALQRITSDPPRARSASDNAKIGGSLPRVGGSLSTAPQSRRAKQVHVLARIPLPPPAIPSGRGLVRNLLRSRSRLERPSLGLGWRNVSKRLDRSEEL